MNTLVVIPKYQHFELPIEAKGRQYIGYFDLSSLIINPYGQCASFRLIDYHNQILQFSVNEQMWYLIEKQVEAIQLDRNLQLYIWLEVDVYGVVQNTRIFQIHWKIHELMTVYQSAYHFDSLHLFLKLMSQFSIPAILQFCQALLDDLPLIARFVSLPASKQHHHSYPGGLLAHSLECALIAQQNVEILSELSIREKEVSVLAALLHDIGKTATLSMDGHTQVGRLMDHELFTLQLLAKPLSLLSNSWPNGIQTLQYLLTWKSSMGYCKYIGGNIVKMADQISTSASLRRMAFKGKPEYFSFSPVQTGNSLNYCNRLH